MEKNILSIDLDIIMHPSIDLYNDDIYVNEDPDELWSNLEEEFAFEAFDTLKYDKEVLLDIIRLLKKNKDKPIIFIKDHDEIVNLLKNDTDYPQCMYNIYNIDFHHDLWYGEDDVLDAKSEDNYTCADWLGYLYLHKKTSSITWIKAKNSSNINIKPYGNKDCKIEYLSIKDFSQLEDINFDQIYFCLSPQWIPPKYRIIYDVIKLLLE